MRKKTTPLRPEGRRIGTLTALIAGFCLAGSPLRSHGQITIHLPDLTLQQNMAGQNFTIPISVGASGAANLNGVQLELIVADGGPGIGGTITGPGITAVSLIDPSTVFGAVSNNGNIGIGNLGSSQVFEQKTSTSGTSSFSLSQGTFTLATIQFDTTGIQPGVYSWSAQNSPNGASFFTTTTSLISPGFVDGQLTVVPEPEQYALAFGLGMAGLIVARRFHRTSQP